VGRGHGQRGERVGAGPGEGLVADLGADPAIEPLDLPGVAREQLGEANGAASAAGG
jgi:hypothetical protein